MFEKIIEDILEIHDDFGYAELEEICQDFYETIPAKIKQETKLKRVAKYMNGEFEVEEDNLYETKPGVMKEYSLETIPKYLFAGKSKIASSLINIINLSKSIGAEPLLVDSNLKINSNDKIALIGKNGAGKTTLLKMILVRLGILQ